MGCAIFRFPDSGRAVGLYLRLFNAAELRLIAQHRPLGTEGEPWPWKSELSVAPWVIYVLASDEGDGIHVDRHHGGR
jgi:hypothetical protein